jgi:hypothetical protein
MMHLHHARIEFAPLACMEKEETENWNVIEETEMKSRGQTSLFVGLLIGGLFLAWAPSASGVAMWSRRYNVACSYCHAYPSLQLNAAGVDFHRRGHRIEKDTFDKDPTHLLSAHVEWEYDVLERQPTKFETPAFHIHAGGALSPAFSVYVDATINEELEIAYLQYTREKGSDSYFTARAGKVSPTLVRNYGNGLLASASAPLIMTDTILGQNPFTPARASFGVDVAGRWKSLFVQAGVVNGEDVQGQAAVNNHKDIYATGEVALPDGISGVGLYYYRGGYDLGNPDTGFLFDRYDRKGVFANFTNDRFRLAGAYLYGKDEVSTLSDRKIRGYYAQADVQAASWIVPFARYDEVKTETEEETVRTRKGTVGCAIRLFENEITGGRLVLEAFRKKEAGESANGAVVNLLWVF